jgi:hypothetical protein
MGASSSMWSHMILNTARIGTAISDPTMPQIHLCLAKTLSCGLRHSASLWFGRVDLGGHPPRSPTDPDVPVKASGSSGHGFVA